MSELYYAFVGLITLGVCVSARPMGHALQLVDYPDGVRKFHPSPTPLLGGFAISLPVAALSLALGLATGDLLHHGVLALAVLGYFALGYADDRYRLSPSVRLLFSILLTLLVLNLVPEFRIQSLKFSFLEMPVGVASWHYVFNLIVVVGFVYALNMADGINGLVAGLLIIWTVLILGFAPDFIVPILIALLAGLVVFFVFNLSNRLFLGDAGSYSLAILIALLSIATYNSNQGDLAADTVAIWFLVPVLDCLRLMVMRVARGKSPLAPDNSHLHHILARWLSRSWALVYYFALVAVPSVLAAIWPDYLLLWLAICIATYCFTLFVGYRGIRSEKAI